MSATVKLATLAAILTAVSVHGAAFARTNGDLNVASGHRPNQTINNLGIKIPSDASGLTNDQAGAWFGRFSDDVVYNGQVVGRDPDRNIRSQILRDN
jgi:hypothetical protein